MFESPKQGALVERTLWEISPRLTLSAALSAFGWTGGDMSRAEGKRFLRWLVANHDRLRASAPATLEALDESEGKT